MKFPSCIECENRIQLSDNYSLVPGSFLFGNLDTWTDNPSSNEEGPSYDTGAVLSSMAADAVASCTAPATRQELEELRLQATVRCDDPALKTCRPLEQPCVFDVLSDPCEKQNLYDKNSEKLRFLEAEMAAYRRTAVKPNNRRSDKFADPKYWNNTWTYWQDLPLPLITAGHGKEHSNV
jgi:arylsulfatase B